MASKVNNITVENARIVFRNFAGKPDKYNNAGGKRQFSLVIDDSEFANSLKEEGWNIKQFKPRDEDDGEPGYYLPVKVSYSVRPPHIYLCTGKSKKLLTEETVESLDYADIASIDIVVSPYEYEIGGKSGISAYAKTMYVNVVEDEFASKYDYDEDDEVPFN